MPLTRRKEERCSMTLTARLWVFDFKPLSARSHSPLAIDGNERVIFFHYFDLM